MIASSLDLSKSRHYKGILCSVKHLFIINFLTKVIMERYFIWVLKSNQFLITFAPHFHRISKAVVKLKPEKNSGLNGIQNPWPLRYRCGALPTELSSYLGATTVTLWVCNISVEGKECKWIYERSNIWTAEKDMNLWLIIEVIHVKLKPEICILHPQRVYYELTKWPVPRWLDSSVGRALHRYRRGHNLKP